MRLKGDTPTGVKIAIQPYPYIKGKCKGMNRSLTILDTDTVAVHRFLIECFEEKAIRESQAQAEK